MRRIIVIGSGGSGKSTLARRLGEKLHLPVIHLDRIYWQPGWVQPEPADWEKKLGDVLRGDSWVLDGNYSRTLAARLAACDTVVYLDRPRLLCLWRTLTRMLRQRGRCRPDMAPGCPERLSIEFLVWIWRYPSRSRHKTLELLEAHRSSRHVVCLRSQAQIEAFLNGAGSDT